MHNSYYIFTDKLEETEIQIQNTLYRKWQKIYPEHRGWPDKIIEDSITLFLDEHRPLGSDMSLDECISRYSLPDTANLINQLKVDGIVAKVTTDGYYVSQQDAETLHERWLQYAPLQDLFVKETSGGIGETYNLFYKKQKPNTTLYLSLKAWSIRGAELYYHKSKENEVLSEIQKWKSLQDMPLDVVHDGCLSIQMAAKGLAQDPVALYDWVISQDICVENAHNVIFLKEVGYRAIEERISHSCDVKPLIRELCKNYDKVSSTEGYQLIFEKVEAGVCPEVYHGSQYIGLSTVRYYYDDRLQDAVISALTAILDAHFLMAVARLVPLTGYTIGQLKKQIDDGVIAGESRGSAYYTSMDECKRIAVLKAKYVGIDCIVNEVVVRVGSDFAHSNSLHRRKLYEYIEHNQWWELEHFSVSEAPELNPKANLYFLSSQCHQLLEKHLVIWLTGFGKSDAEKCQLLIKYFEERYPKTCATLSSYLSKVKRKDKSFKDTCAKELLDFLFYLMDDELCNMSEEELQDAIIIPFKESATLVCKNMLTTYLLDAGYTGREYEFEKTGYSPNVSAYSLDAFSCMAYTVLNPEAWETEYLITKAVESKKFADMWLFVALHFFAAWRSTDFIRVPCPKLNYPPKEVLTRIKEGAYTKEDSRKITIYFMAQVKGLGMTPNKTKDVAYVPELKIFVPASCEDVLGTILSIAAAHYQLSTDFKGFVIKRNQIRDIRKFFGEKFARACDNTGFSTRRANKSLMQAVEGAAGQMLGSMPYVIAACMRSHKGGYGKLPETTERYLKDANFSGYSPEYILYQMFERGICSFYFDAIFKEAFGDSYKKLSISNQTELIKTTGLQAYSLQDIRQVVEQTRHNAIQITREILQSSSKMPQEMLGAILTGDAVGKNWDSLCVLRGADLPCHCPSRLHCVGCIYEIKTKSLLSRYILEYQRISKECQMKHIKEHPAEYGRRQHMVNTVIIPAIHEILQALPSEMTARELKVYDSMIEGGLYSGDAS